MAQIVDITEKLKFEENPQIKIKGKTYELNADATSMIEAMATIGDGEDMKPEDIAKLCNIIFTEKARKELDKLHLKFEDYTTVIKSAINLIIGEDVEKEVGE